MAVECIPSDAYRPMPLGGGLPDECFLHDGKMTKSEVRAITLSKLMPRRGELLWDVGLGCGSVGCVGVVLGSVLLLGVGVFFVFLFLFFSCFPTADDLRLLAAACEAAR